MNTIRTWTARAASVGALSTTAVLGFAGLAHADTIQDTIDDGGTGVTLVAGSGQSGTAAIRLIGNSAGGDADPGCNIDAGENPLRLDVLSPAGVTANPDPLSITGCGTDFNVTFTADSTAVSGPVTVAVLSGPAGGGSYVNRVDIPITVTQPAPTNTRPSVAVKGVADGAAYEIGAVPTATCEATDKEDGPSSPDPVVTGTLSHGLGTQTVSCETTDSEGLNAAASASYTVVDTGNPTIGYALRSSTPANAAGWFKDDVTVDFTCADSGSGIQSCTDDVTRGEGEHGPMTGTATDWAVPTPNSATVNVPGLKVDRTAPSVAFHGGPEAGAEYYYGSVPAAPACDASDTLSGLDGACVVTGGGNAVGAHTYTATATDRAGHTTTRQLSYTVKAWTLKGFTAPVDMNGVWNTVKGGSAVPLKFEVFAGTAEKTEVAAVKSFTQKTVACPGSTATTDEIELTSAGGTGLRYDTTGGQFVQNWQTPKKPGTCAQAVVTTQDGSAITANFMFK